MLPVVPYLKIPSDGEPYLEGASCQACGAISLARRLACPKCGGRDTLAARRLASRGTLYSYSIVHRTFPGVEVPFVSAVVDLEGGGTVKGNLTGVPFDPAQITLGMPVDVVFREAPGRSDKEGNRYLSFFFQPREATR